MPLARLSNGLSSKLVMSLVVKGAGDKCVLSGPPPQIGSDSVDSGHRVKQGFGFTEKNSRIGLLTDILFFHQYILKYRN